MDIMLKVQYKGICPIFSFIAADSDGTCRTANDNDKIIGMRWKDILPVEKGFMYINMMFLKL